MFDNQTIVNTNDAHTTNSEWFYSLKVLAYFSFKSNEQVDFSTYDKQI